MIEDGRTGTAGTNHRRVAIWVLQAYELIAAVLLIWVSAHLVHGALLTATGAVLVLCCLTADGPLGIARWCGPRLHASIVLAVGVASLGALLVAWLRPDVEGLALLVGVQLGLVYLAAMTLFSRASTVTAEAAHGTTATSGPPSTSALDRAARSLGGSAGAGKRTVAARRPALEASARRTLRGAGRLAGRWTSAGKPPARASTDPTTHGRSD